MRDKHYKVKTYRLSEEVHKALTKLKSPSQSWNQFFKELLDKSNKKEI